MGFLAKLKKTLWNSFFGKPERQEKRRPAKKKSRSPKKRKSLKKPAKKTSSAVKSKLIKAAKAKPLKPNKPALKVKANTAKPGLLQKSTKKPAPRLKAVLKAPKPPLKAQVPQGVLIGHVTHFFPQVKAAAIKIEAKNLSVGDEIYFKGATTNFKIKIDSMQINRVPVTLASKGSEIGILVKKRVREGDEVFKL